MASNALAPAYIKLEEAPTTAQTTKTWVPRSFEFSPFLVRQIFRRVELHEKSATVHVVTFRRCLRRLFDIFDSQLPLEVETLGSRKGGFTMTWQDMRHAIDDDRLPKIKLTCAQSTFLIFEEFGSSWLGLIWYMICNLTIILNVVLIIVRSLPGYSLDFQEKTRIMMDACAYLFMFDYITKAITVMACPIALYDEAFLLELVMPLGDNAEAHVAKPLTSTRLERLWYWASQPSNAIDFLSILPNLLSLFFTRIHLPLSALRMLRVLRVLRLLKAFKAVGKWVITLQVVGESVYSSLGSLFVIVLYISLFSLVAGAILYQQEGDNMDEYNDVPRAIQTVSELFIGKWCSITSTIMGAGILASVGMFKGIIFLLPLERIKQATKVAEDKYAAKDKMRVQVEDENRRVGKPKGIEWASAFSCPSARFEVFPDGTEKGGSFLPAVGTLNVPIKELSDVEATICVPLHGGSFGRMARDRPAVEFLVKWNPEKNFRYPKGQLTVQILKGLNFKNSAGTRWRVRLQAPGDLYGETSALAWETGLSNGQAPNPEWSQAGENAAPAPEGTHQTFDIKWEVAEEEKSVLTDEKAFRKRVLELLEDQSQRIADLETQVKAFKH